MQLQPICCDGDKEGGGWGFVWVEVIVGGICLLGKVLLNRKYCSALRLSYRGAVFSTGPFLVLVCVEGSKTSVVVQGNTNQINIRLV